MKSSVVLNSHYAVKGGLGCLEYLRLLLLPPQSSGHRATMPD